MPQKRNDAGVLDRRVNTDAGEGKIVKYIPPFRVRVRFDLTALEAEYDLDDVEFLD